METLKVLYVGIVTVMCASCESTNTKIFPNTAPPDYDYHLELSFIDTSGNDLVKGLRTTEPEGSNESFRVDPGLYTLKDSPNAHELGLDAPPGVTYADPDFMYDLYCLPLRRHAIDSDYYSLAFVKFCPKTRDVETITYTLTCQRIFGDDEPHRIVTHWRKSPSNGTTHPYDHMMCYRVEVDGKEFTDLSYVGGGEWAHAMITLDR
jgi:hypothetical protein